jgi:hypothetical protein
MDRTYQAMSIPGSEGVDLLGADDVAIAGPGQGELWVGPQEAGAGYGDVPGSESRSAGIHPRHVPRSLLSKGQGPGGRPIAKR